MVICLGLHLTGGYKADLGFAKHVTTVVSGSELYYINTNKTLLTSNNLTLNRL